MSHTNYPTADYWAMRQHLVKSVLAPHAMGRHEASQDPWAQGYMQALRDHATVADRLLRSLPKPSKNVGEV